jgi:hypothetical protein
VNVSSQLTKPKGTNIMCRFAKVLKLQRDFHASKCKEVSLHVSSQAYVFPEPEHTFKGASDMMPRQS